MQQRRESQRGFNRHRETPGARRWFVLFLALVFAASGLFHVLGDDRAAFAASPSHEIASISQDTHGAPDCPEHTGLSHGTACCMAGGCSLSLPAVLSAISVPSADEAPEAQPDAVPFGHALSPNSRPPKFSSNV